MIKQMTLLAHDLWAIDDRHVSSDFIGYRPSDHGLARAWRSIKKDPSGWWDPCRVTGLLIIYMTAEMLKA